MHTSKLIKYYRTLSSEEAKGYTAFAKSPYFNTNPQLVKLAEALRQAHPDMDHISLRKERLYKKIYGAGAYQDNKLRKLFSAGVKLIERFWVVEGVEGDADRYSYQLSQSLRHHDLSDEYFKEAEGLIESLSNSSDNDYGYLSSLHFDVFGDKGLSRKKNYWHHLDRSQTNSNAQYFSQKVMLALVWLNLSNIGHAAPSWVQRIDFIEEPPILKKDYGYQNLKQLYELWINHEHIPQEELKVLWRSFVSQSEFISTNYISNFTSLVFNYIKSASSNTHFSTNFKNEVFYWGLDNKAFLYKDKIGALTVYGFCQELCRQNKTIKAKAVLSDYGSHLPIEVRNNTTKLCVGLIHFYENKIEKSYYELVSFSAFKFDQIELMRRAFLLRVGLEYSTISDTIDIESEVNNYTKYIRRNRNLSKSKLGLVLNYANLILRSSRYLKSQNKNISLRNRILKDVNFNPVIVEETKNWFETILS